MTTLTGNWDDSARVLLDARRTPAPGRQLSGREREVLALLATGLANKQIARRLGITERTVKAHLTSVFQQLGVTDRTQAALWARQHLAFDPHADASLGNAYRIHTLYLDTAELDVFHRTASYGRRKFRLRRYGNEDCT